MDGEGIMYDPVSGMGHVLNPTALHIWALCDGSRTAADIERALVDQFPDKDAEIARDVPEAIVHLHELGLLESAAR
jgi:hypothetical protein